MSCKIKLGDDGELPEGLITLENIKNEQIGRVLGFTPEQLQANREGRLAKGQRGYLTNYPKTYEVLSMTAPIHLVILGFNKNIEPDLRTTLNIRHLSFPVGRELQEIIKTGDICKVYYHQLLPELLSLEVISEVTEEESKAISPNGKDLALLLESVTCKKCGTLNPARSRLQCSKCSAWLLSYDTEYVIPTGGSYAVLIILFTGIGYALSRIFANVEPPFIGYFVGVMWLVIFITLLIGWKRSSRNG